MPPFGVVQKSPEWRVLVELFRGLAFGETATHEDIALQTGLRLHTRAYYQQVSRARRELRRPEYGVIIESDRLRGYCRVRPGEHAETARRYLRSGRRRMRVAGRVIAAAPTEHMTPEQCREIEHYRQAMAKLDAAVSSTVRSLRDVLPPVAPKTPPVEDADEQTAH
jgi:hypothetical protein